MTEESQIFTTTELLYYQKDNNSSRKIKNDTSIILRTTTIKTTTEPTTIVENSTYTIPLSTNDELSKLNKSFPHIDNEGLYVTDKFNEHAIQEEQSYQVAISPQTINQILLIIIGVAVFGLLIGVVCRKDFCGIKTKLCRTRRPLVIDQNKPAEEIPLNKGL